MDYVYTIRVTFESMDDIEAKEIAKNLSKSFNIKDNYPIAEIKLQRIYKDKAPEKVNF